MGGEIAARRWNRGYRRRRDEPLATRVTVQARKHIDLRPFRSKAELERELALEAQYRGLANPDVVAALRQMKAGEAERTTASRQAT